MQDLDGKVALITGGSSGIGAETARLFAERGAAVAVGGRAPASGEAVAAEIRASGGRAVAVAADVSDEGQVAAMIADTVGAFGRLDVLHNNAALTDPGVMNRDGAVAELDLANWNRALAVNLTGPMLCAKHALPHLLAAGGGSIIMTGSGKGTAGDLDHTAYGVSKAGLINLTRYIATQYGKQRIRANIMVVGLVLSEALKTSFPAPVREMIESHHLTPYLGETRHIAEVAAFLASDASAFITGAAIPVDGGFSVHSAIYADQARQAGRH